MTDEKQTKEVGTVKTTETVQSAVDLGIYTSLSVAKEEIWRRWNDKELRKSLDLNQRFAKKKDRKMVLDPSSFQKVVMGLESTKGYKH